MFSGASNINSYASGKEIVSVKLPSISSVEGAEERYSNETAPDHTESKDASVFSAFNQQIPDLVTLSLLPKSQWQGLINLDIIKVSLCSFMHFEFNLEILKFYFFMQFYFNF